MADKGVFYIVKLQIEHNRVNSMEILGGPYPTAKELREKYDYIMRTIAPHHKPKIQIIQFVSV